MKPLFSFVLPIFNEEETQAEVYRRIVRTVERLQGESEIILVDDGSRDCSLEIMRDLRRRGHLARELANYFDCRSMTETRAEEALRM